MALCFELKLQEVEPKIEFDEESLEGVEPSNGVIDKEEDETNSDTIVSLICSKTARVVQLAKTSDTQVVGHGFEPRPDQ